ncbi:MAG: hypothetical protein ACETWR_16565 [Anaerolineae bacterium]
MFPEEFHGQAVWSNASGDAPYDTGWRNFGRDYVIHFDVSLPTNGFERGDPVISPGDGVVEHIYSIGDEGQVVTVRLTSSVLGIEDIFANQQEIGFLSKEEHPFDYSPDDIDSVAYHFGHITPWVTVGQRVSAGDAIGEIFFDTPFTPKLAYVLILRFKDGTSYQFSPCMVSNTAGFCDICAPGTPFRCP